MRVEQDHTDWFSVTPGVRQGNVLYHLLFNILLDFVLRKIDTIKCGIEWASGKRLRDFDHAYDIYLLARGVEEMQMIVDTVVTKAD